MRILKGDTRWADLNPVRGSEQAGKWPVLVLSADVFNEKSGAVIAVALTNREPRAGFPLTLELSSTTLPNRSWAKISQIRTLATERLGAKLDRATPEELDLVLQGLKEILGRCSGRPVPGPRRGSSAGTGGPDGWNEAPLARPWREGVRSG